MLSLVMGPEASNQDRILHSLTAGQEELCQRIDQKVRKWEFQDNEETCKKKWREKEQTY